MAMQENTEGTSAPTSEDIVKLWIACLAATFSQHGSASHLSSTAPGANLNLGLAETLPGGGRFYPTKFICICLGHHENKSNLPRRFTSQICPDHEQSKRCPGRDSLLPCSASPGVQRDPGAGTSPLPMHREGFIPQTLCLLVRSNTNAQK